MDTEAKLREAKRKVDMLVGLPGVTMRKGVARSGDPLTGITDYNFKLLRDDDRRWTFYCEWVDPDGEGHRVVLPHKVVIGLIDRYNSIMAQARKERAKHAATNRKQNVLKQAEEIAADAET